MSSIYWSFISVDVTMGSWKLIKYQLKAIVFHALAPQPAIINFSSFCQLDSVVYSGSESNGLLS